jgi:hypothetical protein
MGEYDLTNKSDIAALSNKVGLNPSGIYNLSDNQLTPTEFHKLSKIINLRLDDNVKDIHSNLQTAFNKGVIVIIDDNFICRTVRIKSIKNFVDNLLNGIITVVDISLVSSLKKLFTFILHHCLNSLDHNKETDDNIFKLRFPYRRDGFIYIFIFKIRILNVERKRRIACWNHTAYIADIACLNVVFYVNEDVLD